MTHTSRLKRKNERVLDKLERLLVEFYKLEQARYTRLPDITTDIIPEGKQPVNNKKKGLINVGSYKL